MTNGPLIALLAGARETRAAAAWLVNAGARGVVIWAKGSDPVPLGLPERDTVPEDSVGLVDVTHAFDTHTRKMALAAAPRAAYASVARDPWQPGAGDNWTQVDGMEQAMAALPKGARVFAATGRGSLPALGTHDGPVFLRQLTQHAAPTGYANCTYVFGDAPFDPEREAALLRDLSIDVVLARNIGGAGSFPKLAAARALGLPAVLLRPPQRPQGTDLRSQADVAAWVSSL